jgi:hypothetical protein
LSSWFGTYDQVPMFLGHNKITIGFVAKDRCGGSLSFG